MIKKRGQELINADDFDERLRVAQLDHDGNVAQKFLDAIMPFMRITAENVPWGSYERRNGISHMQSLQHAFCESSMFVTFAPCEMNSHLAIRLAMNPADRVEADNAYAEENSKDNHTWEDRSWEGHMPELEKRAELMANNPAVAAKVFNLLVHAFMCILIRMPLNDAIRTTHD